MPVQGLGEKLRALRKMKGLTLDQLARETGSSKSYIWELENKPVARPSAEKIAKIAALLEVTAEYLLDENRTDAKPDDSDKWFFRRYEAADRNVKQQLQQILKVLDKNAPDK
jgi:transcriptional regulator with XRE-family HTH domain